MEDKMLVLLLFVILSLILAGCLVILLRSYMRLTSRNKALRESVENLGALNDRLRMDRHDYLNHLQIIYGLMELEEYDEMNEYLRKVYKELLKTGKAIKTSKPAINALIAAKMAECEEKGIEFLVEVKSDLKDIGIEDNSLQKIFANLFGGKIAKGQQLSNWEAEILTEAQQRYAATDAWACIKIHEEVARMKREQDFVVEKTNTI